MTSWLVGLMNRVVNNNVQSPKPVYGKIPLGKLMLTSNTSKKIIT